MAVCPRWLAARRRSRKRSDAGYHRPVGRKKGPRAARPCPFYHPGTYSTTTLTKLDGGRIVSMIEPEPFFPRRKHHIFRGIGPAPFVRSAKDRWPFHCAVGKKGTGHPCPRELLASRPAPRGLASAVPWPGGSLWRPWASNYLFGRPSVVRGIMGRFGAASGPGGFLNFTPISVGGPICFHFGTEAQKKRQMGCPKNWCRAESDRARSGIERKPHGGGSDLKADPDPVGPLRDWRWISSINGPGRSFISNGPSLCDFVFVVLATKTDGPGRRRAQGGVTLFIVAKQTGPGFQRRTEKPRGRSGMKGPGHVPKLFLREYSPFPPTNMAGTGEGQRPFAA